MTAGHTAVAEQPADVEPLIDDGIKDRFDHLRNEPPGQPGQQKRVREHFDHLLHETASSFSLFDISYLILSVL
jgi:hypothetical protein